MRIWVVGGRFQLSNHSIKSIKTTYEVLGNPGWWYWLSIFDNDIYIDILDVTYIW